MPSFLAKKQSWFLTLLLVNVGLLFFCFAPVFSGLWGAWQTDEYSHGPVIVVLAVLIGWQRLSAQKPELKPAWSGIWLTLAGFLLLIISRLSAFEPPSHYGLVVALMGLTLTYCGRRVLVVLIPAFAYLIFCIPLPRLIYVGLTAQMQLISSSLGVFILQILDVSVFQEGNIIDLGGYKLQVAEACSGLRYLFPLMSFSFLIALMFEDRLWKRVIVVLSSIPITIGFNSFRIAVIGITVDHWGIQMAEGLLHQFEGWVVFSFCVLILFAEVAVLRNIGNKNGVKGHLRFDYILPNKGRVVTGTPQLSKQAWLTVALCVCLAFFVSSDILNNRVEIVPYHLPFSTFPMQIGDWNGSSGTLSADVLADLQPSDYVLANYGKATDKAPVNLYIAYYNSQRTGASIHSPSNCIPGSGWQVAEHGIIGLQDDHQTIPVTRMLIRKGADATLVYYWFEERGRIIDEQYGAKWFLLVDSITKHRTDGALVRLTTEFATGETEADADHRLQAFFEVSHPVVEHYLPESN